MWAMEYNPKIFSTYEETADATYPSAAPKLNDKLLKQCGKFEKNNVKSGSGGPLAVFLVASVLETKNKQLLKEAKGLDDVIKVSIFLLCMYSFCASQYIL